jgi:asparagine synthase (glutamine-hydrolysing)
MNAKRRRGRGKWLLRELLYRHVPRQLVDRRKHGFAVPIASWLRRELRGWTHDLLDRQTPLRDGLLDTHRMQRVLHEHECGQRFWTNQLWTALMFQAWRRAQSC